MKPDDPNVVPSPGFSREATPDRISGYDPSESPLSRGGLEGADSPTPADAALRGLSSPQTAGRRRAMLRVRREGWAARRQAARSRFATITGNQGSSTPRILKGLERRGILERSKKNAVRPRFNLRGGHL
jgi:hypothetical protein